MAEPEKRRHGVKVMHSTSRVPIMLYFLHSYVFPSSLIVPIKKFVGAAFRPPGSLLSSKSPEADHTA